MDAASVRSSIGAELVVMPIALRRPDEIAAFLRANPGALDLVRLAVEQLPAYFPGDEVVVAVETDPDEPADATLIVSVRTMLPFPVADTALSRFDRDWWIPRIETVLPRRAPVLVTVQHA